MKYNKSATLRFAFKQSLPVLFGYLFLGAAFGIMLFKAGYNWVWAALISLLVYAGSGQFLLVSLISSGAGHHRTDDAVYQHPPHVLWPVLY